MNTNSLKIKREKREIAEKNTQIQVVSVSYINMENGNLVWSVCLIFMRERERVCVNITEFKGSDVQYRIRKTD